MLHGIDLTDIDIVPQSDATDHFLVSCMLHRAVVLESGLGLETFFYRLGLVLDSLVFGLGLGHWTRQMFKLVSTESSNICFFSLFQNKDSLVEMGNVIAIGLTPSRMGIVIGPSRTGIVIGPSRTGIVIGPLLNAQLRHMSVHLPGGINYLYFGHRHTVGKLHYTVWLYKVRWSFPSHFPSHLNTLLMPVRILLSLSFQVNCLLTTLTLITYKDTFSAINMGL